MTNSECTFSKADAHVIFRDASLLKMTDQGYVWVVTEQALEASNVPVGVLGLRLVHAQSEAAHIQDSMSVPTHTFVLFNQSF